MAFTIEAKFVHAGNPARPLPCDRTKPAAKGFTVHDFILKQVRQWAKAVSISVSEKSNTVFNFITGCHPDKPQFHVAACEFPQDCGRLFITNDWLRMAELATPTSEFGKLQHRPGVHENTWSN